VFRRALLIAALAFVSGAGYAVDQAGGAFLVLPLSVRQTGLGGVSVGGEDIMRAWSNPALLAGPAARAEVAFGGSSLLGNLEDEAVLGAGWRPARGIAIGVLGCDYSARIAGVDATGAPTGVDLDRRVSSGGGGAAFQIEGFRAGFLVRAVADRIMTDTVTVGAADFGVAASDLGFTGGFAYRNVGWSGAMTLPRALSGGLAYRNDRARLTTAVELVMVRDQATRTSGGLEWWPITQLGIRAGAADFRDMGGQFTCGLSAQLRSFGLDYALSAHPLGTSHRLSISYTFGPAIPEPPPSNQGE